MASSSATLCHSHGSTATFPSTLTDEEQIPSPPPPTPCNNSLSTGDTDAFLSHLLTRLSLPPPTLAPVLPLCSKQKPITPPVVSLREPNREPFLLAATELGFFHVCHHDIPSHLHETYLQNYRSNRVVSDTTDLRCRGSNDEGHIDMFETDSDDEFAREMKRVGLKVLELLFEEKKLDLGTETRCLMCVSINKMVKSLMEKVCKEHLGSCIVQLTYEGRGKKVPSEVVDDSGKWVLVEAREGAVLVTIGEVAQEEIIHARSNNFSKPLIIKGVEQWKVQETKELASAIAILSSPEQRSRQCTGNSSNNTTSTRGRHSYSAHADNYSRYQH